ncbi:MAG: hypothetical protein SVS85_02625 [Candidatus Nanohaloarchaea archaeon]|nr:hypothetical protein [Candidatus Nanohaloarchaea archaeon]
MGSKAIKVSGSTYITLKQRAEERGESIKEVVDSMVSAEDALDYAGSWDMGDEEAEEIRESREELWEGWEL